MLSGGGGGTKMVGWLDGGAPSAQAAPSDADAVTGAQRDPMQLDERRISGAGSNVEAWASGACACVASSPSRLCAGETREREQGGVTGKERIPSKKTESEGNESTKMRRGVFLGGA